MSDWLDSERWTRRRDPITAPRADGIAIVLLGLLTVGAFWQILFTNAYTLLSYPDDANQSFAWYQVLARAVHSGTVPLWDPYTFGGRPFVGEIQAGAFYLPNLALAFLSLGPSVSSHSIELLLIAHVFAGACFTYALSRYLGLSPVPATLTGVIFGFGGVVLGRIQAQTNLFLGLIWLPLALLALEASLRRRSWLLALVAGVVGAQSLLAGHLEPAYHLMLTLGIFVAWHVVRAGTWRARWFPALAGLLAVVGFIATSAVQILPTVEYSSQALQYVFGEAPLPAFERLPYDVVSTISVHPTNLLSVVLPGITPPADTNPYLGVISLGLAIAGVAWSRHRWVGFLLVVMTVGLLTALGNMSILHGWEYVLVPGSDRVREAGRRLYLLHFAVAMLAGLGLESLLRGRPTILGARWRQLARCGVAPLLVGVLAFLLLTFVTSNQTIASAAQVRDALLHSLLVGSVLLAVGVAVAARRVTGRTGGGIVVAIAIWDLLSAGSLAPQQIRAFDGSLNLYPEAYYAPTPITTYLTGHPSEGRTAFLSNRVPNNLGDVAQIKTTFGHTATILASYYSYYSAANNPHNAFSHMLGVRYYVSEIPQGNDPVVAQVDTLKLFSVANPIPRAWIVHQVSVAETKGAAANLISSPGFDPLAVAVVDRLPPVSSLGTTGASYDRASVADESDQRLGIVAVLGSPGLLVTGDVYYPGWNVFVDGQPSQVVPVNLSLRGVYLPAGAHVVTFLYAPQSFKRGLAITGVSLVILFGLVGAARWRGNRNRRRVWAIGIVACLVVVATGYVLWRALDLLGERDAQHLEHAISLAANIDRATKVEPAGDAPAIGIVTVNDNDQKLQAILQHPTSTVTFDTLVPRSASLSFRTGLDASCRATSQGVVFQITADDGAQKRVVFERELSTVDGSVATTWRPDRVDLEAFAGQKIKLTLSTGPGRSGSFTCDWAEWVDPIIVGS